MVFEHTIIRMKLILQFLKRITLFLKNKSNALEDNNTSLPESKKKNLLQKKKEEIMRSLSFDKRSPQSFELQRKLALLVSNIDKIDNLIFRILSIKNTVIPKKMTF